MLRNTDEAGYFGVLELTCAARLAGLGGCNSLQEGGRSVSSNHGPEGTMNLPVWSHGVKHLNHIVALMRRCDDTTNAATMQSKKRTKTRHGL